MPGETSGPALLIDIKIRNSGKKAITTDLIVVNVSDSKGIPADPVTDPSLTTFSGSIAPGKTVNSEFLFRVDPGRRNPISIQVIYAGGAPIAVFTGRAA